MTNTTTLRPNNSLHYCIIHTFLDDVNSRLTFLFSGQYLLVRCQPFESLEIVGEVYRFIKSITVPLVSKSLLNHLKILLTPACLIVLVGWLIQ